MTHDMCPQTSQLRACSVWVHVQPIADRVALNLQIISKNFRFGTKRTKILMGLITNYLVLIVNPMGRILVRWISFKNNLEIRATLSAICCARNAWVHKHIYMYSPYVCVHVHAACEHVYMQCVSTWVNVHCSLYSRVDELTMISHVTNSR